MPEDVVVEEEEEEPELPCPELLDALEEPEEGELLVEPEEADEFAEPDVGDELEELPVSVLFVCEPLLLEGFVSFLELV